MWLGVRNHTFCVCLCVGVHGGPVKRDRRKDSWQEAEATRHSILTAYMPKVHTSIYIYPIDTGDTNRNGKYVCFATFNSRSWAGPSIFYNAMCQIMVSASSIPKLYPICLCGHSLANLFTCHLFDYSPPVEILCATGRWRG